MSERKQIKERITLPDYFAPAAWLEFLEWVKKTNDAIPKEQLKDAHFELEATESYEDVYSTLSVTYSRLESEEEQQRRESLETRLALQKESNEQAEYLKLKAKYGGTP